MRFQVQVGLRDCGHWTAPFQDALNFATLQAQAADCRSCAAVLNWILTAHESRCDSETAGHTAASRSASRTSRSWGVALCRLGLSCVRGAWFTRKLAHDLGSIILLCGFIALAVAFIPVYLAATIVGVVCGLVLDLFCVCCLKSFVWSSTSCALAIGGLYSICKGIKWASRMVSQSALHMLGTNFGHGEDQVAPPTWTELDYTGDSGEFTRALLSDLESGDGRSDDDARFAPFTQLRKDSIKLAHHPVFRLPEGSSCVRISLSAASSITPAGSSTAGVGCNIYRHTYNPRGPVGSFVYFAPQVGQRENHPTGFLSLGAGRLFVSTCMLNFPCFNTV